MDREKLLAAETFSYSYANYADHLGIGHIRFEKLMPHDVRILERAEREDWPIQKLARALEVDEEMAERFRVPYSRAKDIIDAPHAGESFRRGCVIRSRMPSKRGCNPKRISSGWLPKSATGPLTWPTCLIWKGNRSRITPSICVRPPNLIDCRHWKGCCLAPPQRSKRAYVRTR